MNTAITDLMPVNDPIHSTPFKELINNTIGYFLEKIEDENQSMLEGCFLETAEGKYLDYWGKDYNIPRLADETDEDYYIRLSIIPLEEFTINTAYELYDMQLVTYNEDYDKDTMLVSDNHLLNHQYITDCDDDVWNEVSKKFMVDNILWRLEDFDE